MSHNQLPTLSYSDIPDDLHLAFDQSEEGISFEFGLTFSGRFAAISMTLIMISFGIFCVLAAIFPEKQDIFYAIAVSHLIPLIISIVVVRSRLMITEENFELRYRAIGIHWKIVVPRAEATMSTVRERADGRSYDVLEVRGKKSVFRVPRPFSPIGNQWLEDFLKSLASTGSESDSLPEIAWQ